MLAERAYGNIKEAGQHEITWLPLSFRVQYSMAMIIGAEGWGDEINEV